MTTITQAEELADEIAEAISDTLDMDWKPSWAAPNIIAIINRERRLAYEAGAKAMQWQDISTAPRDGTVILVYRADAGVFTAHFVEEDAHLSDVMNPPEGDCFWFSTEGEDLTHDMPSDWQPLPEPPGDHTQESQPESKAP